MARLYLTEYATCNISDWTRALAGEDSLVQIEPEDYQGLWSLEMLAEQEWCEAIILKVSVDNVSVGVVFVFYDALFGHTIRTEHVWSGMFGDKDSLAKWLESQRVRLMRASHRDYEEERRALTYTPIL